MSEAQMSPTHMRHHGIEEVRGETGPPRSRLYQGRFGRLFRYLPPAPHDRDVLLLLGACMAEPGTIPATEQERTTTWNQQQQEPPGSIDNERIPAGYTYFGQFVDHDLTFDPNSQLERANDPNALQNFRTPRFDLDSVYGSGPADSPYLYKTSGDFAGVRLLIGMNPPNSPDGSESYAPRDLPRNQEGRALTGDPRNDENVIVSQLHLAMLRLHNAFVRHYAAAEGLRGRALFQRAQTATRWLYQWLVVNDFLRRLVGAGVLDQLLAPDQYVAPNSLEGAEVQPADFAARDEGNVFFAPKHDAFMPVEFSAAVYRFGHSLVRPLYRLNADTPPIPIFDTAPGQLADLRGFRRLPAPWIIDWQFFFEVPTGTDPAVLQRSRLIDTKLAPGLSVLPFAPDLPSLAMRNLLRGLALELPSGQDIARAMGVPPLTADEMGAAQLTPDLSLLPPDERARIEPELPRLQEHMQATVTSAAPLWFYVLREAHARCQGKALGPVGGRIVGEVLAGLLMADPHSYARIDSTWEPSHLGTVAGVALDAAATVGHVFAIANVERDAEPSAA